jgi:hypothetical protein
MIGRTVRVTEEDLRRRLVRPRRVLFTGIDTQTGEGVTFGVKRKSARKIISRIELLGQLDFAVKPYQVLAISELPRVGEDPVVNPVDD